jgi:hypothetical protein
MDGKRAQDPKAAAKPTRRKAYRTPRLERLGTLSDLTAAIATSGKNDMAGPGAPFRKS